MSRLAVPSLQARLTGLLLARWPEQSITQLATALVVGTAVPLLLLALFLYWQSLTNARQTARDNLTANARSLGGLVESEIDTHTAVARTLATAESLQRGDVATFRAGARQALETLPGAWIKLVDPGGAIVLSTLHETTATAPTVTMPTPSKVFATGTPQLTDLMEGPISKRPIAFIEVPVLRGVETIFVIAIALNPERFHKLIQNKFGAAPAVGVLDRQRHFVARIPDHEARLGTLAAASWRAQISRSPEGVAETVTLEGVPSITAYATTRDGWIVGLSFPQQLVDAPVSQPFRALLLLGLAALVASATLGGMLGRRVSVTLKNLAEDARKVGDGEAIATRHQRIVEADAISNALSETSRELSERAAALSRSELRFRGTFENTAVGVAHVGLDGRFSNVNGRLCEFLGYTAIELAQLTSQELTHPDDRQADRENVNKLLSGDCRSYTMDKRYVRKDGSVVWAGVTVSLQCDASGYPDYCIKIVRDIRERKEAQAQQQFLLRELAHRMKNQLAVIQAVAGQTARGAPSLEEFVQVFSQRIQGLAVATDALVAQGWTGASIEDLVRRQLAALVPAPDRLVSAGPAVSVGADAAQAIGLALHELATNCVKHGAWSGTTGTVTVSWRLVEDAADGHQLRLNWQERGGPPVSPPTRKGFGHVVIETMAAQKVGGTAELVFAPEGLSWTLTVAACHLSSYDPTEPAMHDGTAKAQTKMEI